jgi:hypothetical protein
MKTYSEHLPSQSEWRRENVSQQPFVVTCNYLRPTAFKNTEAELCYIPFGLEKSPDITFVFVCGVGGSWMTPTLTMVRRKRVNGLAGQSPILKDYSSCSQFETLFVLILPTYFKTTVLIQSN